VSKTSDVLSSVAASSVARPPAEGAPAFYVACGFSGHGFMHSRGLGIPMAEIVLDGRATSMDIDALSQGRFRAGRVHAEANMF